MAASGDGKSILLISVDDMVDVVRYREAFGVTLHTPAIDALMARGVTFENAFCTTPLCSPSRAAVLSGRSAFHNGVHDNQTTIMEMMPATETLLGQAHEAGWYTAARGKLFHGQADEYRVQPYLKDVLDEADWYGGYLTGPYIIPDLLGDSPVPEADLYDTRTADWATAFLQGAAAKAPFFLSVGISKPHFTWDVPKRYYDLYDRAEIVVPEIEDLYFDDLPAHFRHAIQGSNSTHLEVLSRGPEFWGDMVHGYLAAISYADAQIGRVLEAMTEAGLWDDTTVLLWSDHGHHLGDREIWQKFTLWEEATSVPLIVVDPDVGEAGMRVSTPASTLDIWPTLSGLTGLPAPPVADGLDLSALMADPEAEWPREGVITSIYGSISVRTEAARYTLYPSGEEELYLTESAQVFGRDVSADPALGPLMEEMRALLHREAAAIDVKIAGPGQIARGDAGDDVIVVVEDGKAVGGPGDDVYHATPEAVIVEKPDGGTDRIIVGSAEPWRMPNNVEIGVMTAASRGTMMGNGLGNDLRGNKLDNEIFGYRGDDRLNGTRGLDTLRGGDGNDTLFGGTEADRLYGGPGDDYLHAYFGDDLLVGHKGDDRLIGGKGADEFRFRIGDGADEIVGFNPAADRIVFVGDAGAVDSLSLTVDGADVVVRYGETDSIRLLGVDLDALGPWQFIG